MKINEKDFEKIIKIGIELTTETDRNKLLASILDNAMDITHCDASTLYLIEGNKLIFKIMKTLSMGISSGEDGTSVKDMPPVEMTEKNVCAYTAIHREIVNIPDVYHSDRFDFSGPKEYDVLTGYHTKSMLVIPLENNEGELLGVLQLINAMDGEGNVIAFDEQHQLIIRSLGSMSAIELTNLNYTDELKAQLYSFVEAFATAVDERTPYNGLHTRKVAQYCNMLVEYINKRYEAGECDEYFDETRMEKLFLAARLHDIGKMIVPLGIMNRATRLDQDMVQVENRFELLAAYYEVDMLRGTITESEYQEKTDELKEEMAFIHKIDRVGYLDDESYRHVKELAEKKYIKRDGTVLPYLTEREIDCLSIRKGTLTDTDRRQMESHVVMTEKILEKVRLNESYKMVPRWAASHHEFLDGSGYPNGLKGDEIDFETRVLTVADIYDAMTSTDRPYKKPMPKAMAFSVLRSMAKEGKLELRIVDWLEETLKEENE